MTKSRGNYSLAKDLPAKKLNIRYALCVKKNNNKKTTKKQQKNNKKTTKTEICNKKLLAVDSLMDCCH